MASKIWLTCLLFLTFIACGVRGAHFSYTPDVQTHPCIMLDAVFTIKIDAIRYARTIASDFYTSEDEVITTSGSCGAVSILNLAFSRGDVSWSFIFRTNGDVVTLERLIQFVPTRLFAPYVSNISDPITFEDPHTIDLSFKNESYYCRVKKNNAYVPVKAIQGSTSFSIHTTMKHVRAQAFNVKEGRYSHAAICHDDLANATTRSTSTTTATTTTLTPTSAPDNVFYVYNSQNTSLCIALAGRIDVNIRYKYNTSEGVVGTRTLTFPVPSNATSDGNCDLQGGKQNIVIEFFNPSWKLEFVFNKKSRASNLTLGNDLKGKSQKTLDYNIENINLQYWNNHQNFPDTVLPDGIVKEFSPEEESQYPHKSKNKGYFTCSADLKLKINKNAGISTEEFKFKAFNEDKHTQFEGNPSECSADDNDDTEHAVIIVASVIGGVVLIIIIIVVIIVVGGRKRRRRNYKPIKGKDKNVFVYR